MAVVTTKATAIANRDSAPAKLTDAQISNGMLRESVGTVELISGDSIASKYVLACVPSGARVSELLLSCDDIGTTTAADFGLYKSTADGGAVIDPDFFGSAVALNAGALNQSIIQNESGVFDIANIEKTLWEALGLAADPKIMYDIVATLTAAADGSGTMSVKVRFVI